MKQRRKYIVVSIQFMASDTEVFIVLFSHKSVLRKWFLFLCKALVSKSFLSWRGGFFVMLRGWPKKAFMESVTLAPKRYFGHSHAWYDISFAPGRRWWRECFDDSIHNECSTERGYNSSPRLFQRINNWSLIWYSHIRLVITAVPLKW